MAGVWPFTVPATRDLVRRVLAFLWSLASDPHLFCRPLPSLPAQTLITGSSSQSPHPLVNICHPAFPLQPPTSVLTHRYGHSNMLSAAGGRLQGRLLHEILTQP